MAFCVTLFSLLNLSNAQASHLAGADLTYQCLGNNQYRFTLQIYRDCDGITLGTSANISFTSASGCAPNFNVTAPLDTSYEVSQLCPAQLPNSSCNSTAANALPGIQVYRYVIDVTLPPNCTDWVASWSSCCRNAAVTTISSPGSAGFYVSALVNTNYCNNSPVFSSLPVPYFYAGNRYNYNHGAFDPDGDSLIFELTAPLTAAATPVNFIGGATSGIPLRIDTLDFATGAPLNKDTLLFNTTTGSMDFRTLRNTAQFAVAGVTVYEIRNGDTIGFIKRDIQMVVINDPNATQPVASAAPLVIAGGGFDSSSNSFIVCAGQTLDFQISLTDPDGDSISLDNANTNITQVFGSSVIIVFQPNLDPVTSLPRYDSVTLFVRVPVTPSNLGANNFIIGVTDNACPIPGSQILGFNIIVPGVEVTASDTTICPGIAQTLQMTANSFSSSGALLQGSYKWVQRSGTPITFSDDTLASPTINVPAATLSGDSIVLEVTYITQTSAGACTTTDDVTIYLQALPLNVNSLTVDTSLCPNFQTEVITFNPVVTGPGIDLVNGTYSWSTTPASALSSLSSINTLNPTASVSGGRNDSITYSMSYTYGLCVGTDSIKVRWRSGIPILSTQLDTICPTDTIIINAALTDTVINRGTCNDYVLSQIPFAPYSTASAVGAVTDMPSSFMGDDRTSNITIGFPFDFYCNTFTQVRASSNGFLTFDLTAGSGAGNFPIPSTAGAENLIAFAWDDLVLSGANDTARYFTVGTAPNRKFVYEVRNAGEFSGNADVATVQVVLHETTGYIDIHNINVQTNDMVLGIEDATGTIGVTQYNGVGYSDVGVSYRFEVRKTIVHGPISLNWTPGTSLADPTAGTTNAFPLTTTRYFATITQGTCSQTDSVDVIVRSAVLPPVVTCGNVVNQASTVRFNWNGSAGATSWEYRLNNDTTWFPKALADTTLFLSGVANGDSVTIYVRPVTNIVSACPFNAATKLTCYTIPCPPANSIVDTVDVSCFGGANAIVGLTSGPGALGAHPNYTVTLYDTAFATAIDTLVTPDTARFTNLIAGAYYMTIKDTLGCEAVSDTVVITQPTQLQVAFDTTQTTCFGYTNGTATLLATGGTPGYSYLWGTAAGNQATMIATGLAPASYSASVTDTLGCVTSIVVPVTAKFLSAPTVLFTVTENTSCTDNGTATVTSLTGMSGAASAYTYLWSNGQAIPSVSGLPSGDVYVTITDINGCSLVDTATVLGTPGLTLTAIPTTPSCNATDGAITLVVQGDTVGYTYLWDAAANNQTTNPATNLGVGTYNVTVTGTSNSCTVTDAITLNNLITGSVTFNTVNSGCDTTNPTGSATVVSSVIAPGSSVLWNTGATTNTISNLKNNIEYFVTVTDANGCVVVDTVQLADPVIAASIQATNDPDCNLSNGSIVVIGQNAPGTNPAYTYNWSNGQTANTAVGLSAGTYTVTVNYQGCTDVISTTLNNSAFQIAIDSANTTRLICNNNGTATLAIQAFPATSGPQFIWSGPNGFVDSTATITNLADGLYSVTATTANGACEGTLLNIEVVNLTVTVDASISTIGQDTVTVKGNTSVDLDAAASANTAGTQYTWTTTGSAGSIADPTAATTTVNEAVDGVYIITVNAQLEQCIATDSVTLTVNTVSFDGLPNAFLPDHPDTDIANFKPINFNGYTINTFQVFNRWGQMVYNNTSTNGWDGRVNGVLQPAGTYIYLFEYEDANGNLKQIRGEVNLIY